MIKFFYTKDIEGYYGRPSSFGGGEKRMDWDLLDPLVDEVWSHSWKIDWVRNFLNAEMGTTIDENTTTMNDVYLQKNDGFIVISFEWADDKEFPFPEEKFKQFIAVLNKASETVCSDSIYETSDKLKFTIDDNWNTRIEGVFLSEDTSFFEKDDSGMPQFRFERVKGHQYKLVQNDCINDQTSKTLGVFIEDAWMDSKILDKSIDFKNGQKDGVVHYGTTFLKKEGSGRFILGLGKESNPEHELIFSKDTFHRFLTLTRLFLKVVPDLSVDKLPGVIFFTFDKYWNLIPVPLFRPVDKNFVDKE